MPIPRESPCTWIDCRRAVKAFIPAQKALIMGRGGKIQGSLLFLGASVGAQNITGEVNDLK